MITDTVSKSLIVFEVILEEIIELRPRYLVISLEATFMLVSLPLIGVFGIFPARLSSPVREKLRQMQGPAISLAEWIDFKDKTFRLLLSQTCWLTR